MQTERPSRPPPESLRKPFLVSIVLHGGLVAAVLVGSQLGLSTGAGWGSTLGGGTAVRVGSVSSLRGIPLPPAVRARTSTVANRSQGLHQSRPEPKKPPDPTPKTEIQKFDKAVPTPKFEKINPRIQEEQPETPDNAIPYGEGGAPTISYAQFSGASGEGGFNMDAGFGEQYAWYVQAVRNRVSSNWLLNTVSPSIITAPRLFVSFDIQRSGQIRNAKLTGSSGIPEIDRSGLRAILASNPLPPLPPDFVGSKVTVEFWFDFRRQR